MALKIMFRQCSQCGFEQSEWDYVSVKIENERMAELWDKGYRVYGAEVAPDTMEGANSQHTTYKVCH